MCQDCVKEEYPDRGSLCLDSGTYLANLLGCHGCGHKDTLKSVNRATTSNPEFLSQEVIEYDHVCGNCSHVVATHDHRFWVEEDYQYYEMSLVLFLTRQIRLHLAAEEVAKNEVPEKKNNLEDLVIIIREFESFDNDVSETVESVLKACNRECKIAVVSDERVYPPLHLPKEVQSHVLTPGLLYKPPDLKSFLTGTKYVLLLPDGARCSSATQLLDLIHVLETGDWQVVAVGVGGSPLTCHRYTLDIQAWTLSVAPAPQSEACDAVSGRAALLMRTNSFLLLTHPLARPVSLSVGIQGAARSWKVHVSRGGLLGEGRQLYASEHFQWKLDAIVEEQKRLLYAALGVKKVVSSGGNVLWYGCTKTTPRCFPTVVGDTPEYLYQGRWTPPCCLEGLRATARHVFRVLRTCRARWWLEGGSLLGAVRSGDIIPWDYDVDVGIYSQDVDRCPQLKSARWQTLEDDDGYVWQRASEGGFFRVHYSTANHLHVDVFPFTPKRGLMTRGGAWSTGHKQDIDFPEHFLRPLASVNFAGVMASAPNNVRDFLELKFGSGVIENPQYPNPEILLPHNISLPQG
ncbi:Phosphatidylinositol 3-kinase catalytic subunit type 3 [Halocaridina rubra]|uniref:Phosphatidylinositol 3-kinase catalytic subunit type 3 n=1 Tax=Halocaridina rubra TaxID=373956 RepID=A0AAN9AE68_HALRR